MASSPFDYRTYYQQFAGHIMQQQQASAATGNNSINGGVQTTVDRSELPPYNRLAPLSWSGYRPISIRCGNNTAQTDNCPLAASSTPHQSPINQAAGYAPYGAWWNTSYGAAGINPTAAGLYRQPLEHHGATWMTWLNCVNSSCGGQASNIGYPTGASTSHQLPLQQPTADWHRPAANDLLATQSQQEPERWRSPDFEVPALNEEVNNNNNNAGSFEQSELHFDIRPTSSLPYHRYGTPFSVERPSQVFPFGKLDDETSPAASDVITPSLLHQFYSQQQYGVGAQLQPVLTNPPSAAAAGSHKPKRRQTKEALVPLISRAILSRGAQKATLGEICQFIADNSPDYGADDGTEVAAAGGSLWQNNVRHTLSHYEFFVKAGRIPTGRGNYWMVHPVCRAAFQAADFRIKRARHAVQQFEKRMLAASSRGEGQPPQAAKNRANIGA